MHLHYPPIHQTPLLEFLFDQDSKDFIALAQEHGIDSLLWNYRSSLKNPEIERSLLKAHQTNLQKNILFLHAYEELNQLTHRDWGWTWIPLKGLSLLNTIYPLGDRPLTDIDLYTDKNISDLAPWLKNQGYLPFEEKKWLWINHKFVFVKKTPLLDITIELHTQLYVRKEKIIPELGPSQRLTPCDEFLYLSYHWAEQHTCLKLFWLWDLYFYWQTYKTQIQDTLWDKAESYQLKTSLQAVYYALTQNFSIDDFPPPPADSMSSLLLKKLMQPEPLFTLHQNRKKYLLLKHLVRDSLWASLRYNSLWALQEFEKNLLQIKKNLTIPR